LDKANAPEIYSGAFAVLAFILGVGRDRNGFDFDHHIQRQAGDFNGGTRGLNACKIRAINAVQRGEVVQIFQKDSCLDDAVQTQTFLLQNGRQIPQALTHLGLEVPFHNSAGGRVERKLAGDEQKRADPNGGSIRRSLQRPSFRVYRFFFHASIMAAIGRQVNQDAIIEYESNDNLKAMILAAGEGTRLRPLTEFLPKPMVPIVGMPLLERTLVWLAGQGITEVAINLFHRPQRIPDYFGDSFAGVRLHYFFEDTLRGTSGGVKAAEGVFKDAPFFVIYGDNLVYADLRRLAEFHASQPGIATLGLFQHPNPTAAGIAGLDGNGRITRFVEKPPADEVFSGLANAGVYVLDPAIFEFIPPNAPSDFGRDIFPALLAQNVPLYGTPLGGYLQDTGTPEAYRRANFDLLAGRAGVQFENSQLWIALTAQIGVGVSFIGRNIVDAGVQIGDGAVLADSILLVGASAAPGAQIRDRIVGDGFSIPLVPITQEP